MSAWWRVPGAPSGEPPRRERLLEPALITAVSMAADTDRNQAALRLPLVLADYLAWRRRFDEWLAAATISVNTAQLGLYGEYLKSGAGVEVSERSIEVSRESSVRSAASLAAASGSASSACWSPRSMMTDAATR